MMAECIYTLYCLLAFVKNIIINHTILFHMNIEVIVNRHGRKQFENRSRGRLTKLLRNKLSTYNNVVYYYYNKYYTNISRE